MPTQPHVIVLGLGIVGSSIAAVLASRGFRVTGVEQFSPLHERGSSHGDTRIFRRVPHEGEVYVEMAEASYAGWHAWNSMAKENLFVECGGIDAGPESSKMVNASEELCRRYRQPFETMDGKAFNRRHPHYKLPVDWRVVYQPLSGFVRPDATRTFLHTMARKNGVKLLHETAVIGIDYGASGTKVRTEHGTIAADFLVVAAGAWLPKIFPELNISISTERRALAWFETTSGAKVQSADFPIFVLDADGGWYGMPTPDGRLKIGHDKHLRQQIDPDQLPVSANTEDAMRLSACIRNYFVGFSEQPCEMKPCIYTLTEDHHFIIDRHPEHANVLIFSCCSGHGFKYAPAYGEIAADLISGKPRSNLASLRLTRDGNLVTRFSD
ncbi:MAG TPA: N-methyl-L-tryptophan oxidase [Acidobacteriaceae bacterium]|jgi:sarcosine oxidase|nr:N-methyl-L-tryptophan oxidase [Acidobacteriaceae bacterium]